MKKVAKVIAFFCVLLMYLACARLCAQEVPGALADANSPFGAPDPEKLDQIWQVDPISGQVSIKIPFTTTPQGGRGPKIPFALMYNSASTITLRFVMNVADGSNSYDRYDWLARPDSATGTNNNPNPNPAGPWTTSGPYENVKSTLVNDIVFDTPIVDQRIIYTGCIYDGPFNYTDANGSMHDLNEYDQSFATSNTGDYVWPCGYGGVSDFPSYTTDGSALYTASGREVTHPDGTSFAGGNNGVLTDANGNSDTMSTVNGVTTVTEVTDALGRTVYSTNIPINQPGQIPPGTYYVTTTGATGQTETYTVVFQNNYIQSFTMPHPAYGNAEFASDTCLISCPDALLAVANPPRTGDYFSAVTSITLPDGTSYGFVYDPVYGTISRITFPTGGSVSFTWGVQSNSGQSGSFQAMSALVVTGVTTSTLSSYSEGTWSYNIPTVTTYTMTSAYTTSMTAPDHSYTVYTPVCFIYSAVPLFNMHSRPACKEATHTTYAYQGGPIVESEIKEFIDGTVNNGLPTQIATTLYGGAGPEQKQVAYTYDNYSNIIEKDESDYTPCSGAPCPALSSVPWIRKTFTAYAYASNSTLLSKYIVDKPQTIVVTDGSGKAYAMTQYSYDNNGNVTNESKCLSVSGTVTSPSTITGANCSSYWQTSYTYDTGGSSPTGQLLTKTDGFGTTRAATTTYTWGDASGGSANKNFLVKVTYPNNSSESYTYYAPTGQMETHTDANGNKTQYSYDDPLNRLTKVVAPATVDGTTGNSASATTNYSYNDASEAFSVQETQSIDAAGTKSSTTTSFDGLGRKISTVSASPTCSSGSIETDISYDAMSRVNTTTNPHCATSDKTYGITAVSYDALGRKTKTTLPDNSVSSIAYAVNATMTTDPPSGSTALQHVQQADGLGRTTSVCEVTTAPFGGSSPGLCNANFPGVSGFVTGYTYDPLGNLQNVSQHGVSRSFSYDSLSRLLTSQNPEVGGQTYIYSSTSAPCSPDPSVPCSRTDHRGIVTSYNYDKMSRLLSKSYSDSLTPASCYLYDNTASGANGIGRLWYAWSQLPGTSCSTTAHSASTYLALKSFRSYDAMGRPTQATQQACLNGKCVVAATPYSLIAAYNLAGNLTTLTNSVGAQGAPLTLQTTFDAMARPCLMTSSWTLPLPASPGTAAAPATLFQVNPSSSASPPGYWPHNALGNWTLGSTSPSAASGCSAPSSSAINAQQTYGPRLWLTNFTATGQVP